ncbi:MAG: hypothetical protein P4N41_01995 [Negativicutes bacterium]|nr:hypothetical protein [Negativicutes bacterium]
MVTADALEQVSLKADLRDIIQVFVYDNLSIMVSPNPLLRLPPATRNVLEAYINFLTGGYGFPKDIQEILNVFILTNLNSISMRPSPVVTNPS